MKPNPQQQAVIDHIDGPCLVTAVPGSGKTASVTERTKNMISKGIDPSSILAITFTKKAAEEMRSRIAAAVGEKASKMTVSTFHALCARIIRGNAGLLGLTKTYTIYDEDDQERLLKRCISKIEDVPEKRNEAGFLVAQAIPFKATDEYKDGLMAYIEGMRNAALSPEEATYRYQISNNQFAVAKLYFEELRKADAVDFTGLLSETIRLFDEHPEVLERYRAKFRYISVDEVQDTNVAQYRLIKQLGLGHKNVLMVGDLDQSIYRFRNASPENLLEFEKDFGAKVLKLEVNYRSTPQILRHSQSLIENNKLRKGTQLKTDNPAGKDFPKVVGFKTDDDMAGYIASEIRGLVNMGVKPSQIAVLYRINSASRVIEKKIIEKGLPYRVIGGLDFFSRKEIKACLAVLKLLCNESDKASFEKVCEYCCRGVGEKAISMIMDHSASEGVSVTAASKAYLQTGTPQSKALAPLVAALDAGRQLPANVALLKVAKETAFWDKMEKESTTENDRVGNIREMALDVERFLGQGGTLVGYLQNITLMTAQDGHSEDAEVKLMSMHACKGLEFDVVFVSHAMNEIIPHARTLAIEDQEERSTQLEEERRLLYVAMTRARKVLRICFCRYGMQKQLDPSPFLYETGLPVPNVTPPEVKKTGKSDTKYKGES